MATGLKMRRDSKIRNHGAHRPGVLRSPSGQTLLEVTLLLPVLLTLMLGVIEIGRYAYIQILVANAARAGAAYGAQNLAQSVDTAGIQTAADNDYQNNGEAVSTLTVTSLTSCGCDNAGTLTAAASCTGAGAGTCAAGHWVVSVSVTAKGTFNSLFGYPGIPKSMSVTSTSTMRVAQ